MIVAALITIGAVLGVAVGIGHARESNVLVWGAGLCQVVILIVHIVRNGGIGWQGIGAAMVFLGSMWLTQFFLTRKASQR